MIRGIIILVNRLRMGW